MEYAGKGRDSNGWSAQLTSAKGVLAAVLVDQASQQLTGSLYKQSWRRKLLDKKVIPWVGRLASTTVQDKAE